MNVFSELDLPWYDPQEQNFMSSEIEDTLSEVSENLMKISSFPTPPHEEDYQFYSMASTDKFSVSNFSSPTSDMESTLSSELKLHDVFDLGEFENESAIDKFVNELDASDIDLNEKVLQDISFEEESTVSVDNCQIAGQIGSDARKCSSGADNTSNISIKTSSSSSEIVPYMSAISTDSSKMLKDSAEPSITMMKVSYAEQFRHFDEEVPLRKRYSKKSKRSSKKQAGSFYSNSKYEEDVSNVEPSRRAAVQAKINREKKKAYISSLEMETHTLKSENKALKECKNKLEINCKSLMEEVAYLKNVLANQSMLSGLLKNISSTKGLMMKSSISERTQNSEAETNDDFERDHDYFKSIQENVCGVTNTGGVCLHVDQNNVSLEFCSKCARKAQDNFK